MCEQTKTLEQVNRELVATLEMIQAILYGNLNNEKNSGALYAGGRVSKKDGYISCLNKATDAITLAYAKIPEYQQKDGYVEWM